MPGPYWQDPAGADYGSASYGGTGRGGTGRGGAGYNGSRRAGPAGSSRGGSAPRVTDASAPARQPRGGGQDGYPAGGGQEGQGQGRRASQGNGRSNGWGSAAARSSGAARGAEDPWDVQRGRGGARRSRPEPAADGAGDRGDRGRGGSRARGDRPAAPAGGADRSPQGSRGDRGYPAEQGPGTGQVAQDLRDRLGVRGSRNGRGSAAPSPAGRRGRARASGAALDGAGNNGAGYDGAAYSGADINGAGRRGTARDGTGLSSAARNGASRNGAGAGSGQGNGPRGGHRAAAGYADEGYGRTLQRGRPGTAGDRDWRGEDDPRTPGGGRRSGHGTGGRGAGPGGGGRGGGGRSGGGRRGFKEWFLSGTWWRRWTWKKALGVVAAICVGVPVLLLVAFFVAYEKTGLPTDTTAAATAAPSQVYYSDKRMIASFSDGGLNRQILTAEQIPTVMNNAIIAAEDRHFYSEGGISPTGILRAAYEDIKGGSVSQGGSTLTEQFVKNYYAGFAAANNTDKSANDKFKQVLVAIKLAHTKSKSWILTQYLNTVYFGQNAYGVGAAAQTYFNKPASNLTVTQAAMLAAMVNEPGYFTPDRGAGQAYTALVQRWQYVLTNMVRDGALTQAQAAKEKFPKVHYHLSSSLNGYKGYLMQMVDQELTKTYHLSQAQLNTGGLKIYTTFSQSMMSGLYKAVVANKAQMKADGRALPSYAYIGAVLERPTDGSILAVYGGPGYNSNAKACQKVDCYLNMAEDPKQVGSSFKPYVLATAVSQGMNVQTSKLNGYSPLWIPEGTSPADQMTLSSRTQPTSLQLGQQPYVEFNEPSEDSKAPLTVPNAAAISSDPAFEDLAHRDGVQNIINMAKQFGVGATPFTQSNTNDWAAMNAQYGSTSKVAPNAVNIALGESDLTAVEQASTFATVANDGVYHTPHVIAKIVEGGGSVPLQLNSRQVLTPAQAADVSYALSFDTVPGGTAYPNASWPGQSVIGKTGTTQTAQDAWFIGAIPGYSLGVTLFTNEQDSSLKPGAETLDILPILPGGNPLGGYGGEWPAAIWHTFMLSEFTNMAPETLPTPNFNGFATWDQVNGMQPASPSPSVSAAAPSAPATPTCSPQPGFACTPGGSLSPSPPVSTSPPATTPSPTCPPQQFGAPCVTPSSPVHQGNTTTAYLQPADEATPAARLLSAAAVT